MTQRQIGGGAERWIGEKTGKNEAFGGGQLWIGQHTADQDVLVLDPAETDPTADVLRLYSLSQHRVRSFPRAVVVEQIRGLTDELQSARAKKDYAQRDALRASHEQELADESSARKDRQRDGVIAAHRRYVESIGLEYQGETETASDHRPGRRYKCHACGIALDDFAGAVCVICNGVLCSCGTCACKVRPAPTE